jgi:hypothetical protein
VSGRKKSAAQSEMIRRQRLGDLRKLFRERWGPILPDDDAGREDLRELLLPISLGPYEAVKRPRAIEMWGPNDRMRHEIEVSAPWMPQDEAQALIDEINQMPLWQRKPKARTLGERLNVTYGKREELHLRTILPVDVTDAGMALIRKRKKRKRDKLRRLKRGQQSRADYLAANNKSKEQPWIKAGKSRASWYRQQRETSQRQVNLNKGSQQPVSPVNRLVSKKEVAEQEQLVSSTELTSEAQKTEMSVTDKAIELIAPTCLTNEQTSNRPVMLPPGVNPNDVPTWVLMLPPDMAAMATVAWFYGSLPQFDVAA